MKIGWLTGNTVVALVIAVVVYSMAGVTLGAASAVGWLIGAAIWWNWLSPSRGNRT